MALKITTNIGTDRGITNEAYIRISDYNLSKNGGGANFRLEIFQSSEDATPSQPGIMASGSARNQQIGENLYVSFWKTIETEVTRTRIAMPTPGTSGSAGSGSEPQMEEYQETVITQELDFSAAEATNIFAFGYSELKKKLKTLFGDSNVVDC
jgi:hypothetical protein